MKNEKIVHVHFITTHRNYYFGSVTAIFKKFDRQTIGCSESYLRHILTKDGNHYLTKNVLIVRSRLISISAKRAIFIEHASRTYGSLTS